VQRPSASLAALQSSGVHFPIHLPLLHFILQPVSRLFYSFGWRVTDAWSFQDDSKRAPQSMQEVVFTPNSRGRMYTPLLPCRLPFC
jgi:hypothetical protein